MPTASLVSLEDAATMLGYTPSGLRKIINRTRAGKPGPTIQFFQVGKGPIKFRPEWIDEFIAANTVKLAAQRQATKPLPVRQPERQSRQPQHLKRPA